MQLSRPLQLGVVLAAVLAASALFLFAGPEAFLVLLAAAAVGWLCVGALAVATGLVDRFLDRREAAHRDRQRPRR